VNTGRQPDSLFQAITRIYAVVDPCKLAHVKRVLEKQR
jgi:hypothetical protein